MWDLETWIERTIRGVHELETAEIQAWLGLLIPLQHIAEIEGDEIAFEEISTHIDDCIRELSKRKQQIVV